MTLCKEAQDAIRADVRLSRLIKTWDNSRTQSNAQGVIIALLDPTTVGTTYAEISQWRQRLSESTPG